MYLLLLLIKQKIHTCFKRFTPAVCFHPERDGEEPLGFWLEDLDYFMARMRVVFEGRV